MEFACVRNMFYLCLYLFVFTFHRMFLPFSASVFFNFLFVFVYHILVSFRTVSACSLRDEQFADGLIKVKCCETLYICKKKKNYDTRIVQNFNSCTTFYIYLLREMPET